MFPEYPRSRKEDRRHKAGKNKVVKSQRFEEAAALRDTEKRLGEELDKAKTQWRRKAATNKLSNR